MNEQLKVTITTTQAHKINCSTCNLPAAQVVDGAFVWHSHHNGKKHINAINAADLQAMLTASRTIATT